uniref:Ig-like domain-containing protein n=1 Tax=Macrostomum lignano TaxID=282301 RepID=A0A1I8G1Q3_9PLAT
PSSQFDYHWQAPLLCLLVAYATKIVTINGTLVSFDAAVTGCMLLRSNLAIQHRSLADFDAALSGSDQSVVGQAYWIGAKRFDSAGSAAEYLNGRELTVSIGRNCPIEDSTCVCVAYERTQPEPSAASLRLRRCSDNLPYLCSNLATGPGAYYTSLGSGKSKSKLKLYPADWIGIGLVIVASIATVAILIGYYAVVKPKQKQRHWNQRRRIVGDADGLSASYQSASWLAQQPQPPQPHPCHQHYYLSRDNSVSGGFGFIVASSTVASSLTAASSTE